ncbi:methyltransferase [Bradyrhizobium sp. SZCCHNRI1009]|uniref:methyltransferase n=1 Tax=Bradyrhizobium sp. SZCCHNRI1009 TaxID=3057277 RepID=UPI002915F09D|nr:methyltransferase [Bradyrhizobium sp. SZCCHNRI1009]
MLNSDQLAATRAVLDRNALVKQPHDVCISGLQFAVLPNVLSPQFFASTGFLANAVSYRAEDAFLEIGPGMGAISVLAALRGAKKVVAIDINPDAVTNTRINASLHGVSNIVDCREGDIFEPLHDSEKFDTIFWNIPFVYIDEAYEYQSLLEKAVFDPGYRLTERFIRQAADWLVPNGRLLVGFGDFGDIERLSNYARSSSLQMTKVASVKAKEVNEVEFILFELTPSPISITLQEG